MATMSDVFDDGVIGDELWPVHYPDFMPRDFHLWGSLKHKMYKRHLHTLHEPEENIQEEISRISRAQLQHVNRGCFHASMGVNEQKGNTFNTSSKLVIFAQRLFCFLVPHLKCPVHGKRVRTA
jgi:hypothetical protein